MKSLLFALALVLIPGCTSRRQVELVADARAGAQALQAEQDPGKRALIAAGLAATVIAATEQVPDLPKPKATASEIRSDPAAFAKAAEKAQADPPPFVPADQPPPRGPGPVAILSDIGARALSIGAWAALAGVVALLLRFVPWWGIGTLFSWGPLSTLAGLSASTGTFATVAGAAAMWMADYLWIVVLVSVVAGIGVAVYHRADIRKIVLRVREQAKKNKARV
jgi:hypothetical protein